MPDTIAYQALSKVDCCDTAAALWPEVAFRASRARLPLVNLALPSLHHLRPDEFHQFSQALQWLIESDAQIESFEFVLQKIVRRHLAPQSGETRSSSIQYHTLKPLVRDGSVVLSALANVSSCKAGEVEKVFRARPNWGRRPTGCNFCRATKVGWNNWIPHPPVQSPTISLGVVAVDNNTHTTLSTARLSPRRLGWAFGATGVVFYLGCMLTMAIVPREKAVVLFNGLLHEFNVDPILKTGVPVGVVTLGLVTTFILGLVRGGLYRGGYIF